MIKLNQYKIKCNMENLFNT